MGVEYVVLPRVLSARSDLHLFLDASLFLLGPALAAVQSSGRSGSGAGALGVLTWRLLEFWTRSTCRGSPVSACVHTRATGDP